MAARNGVVCNRRDRYIGSSRASVADRALVFGVVRRRREPWTQVPHLYCGHGHYVAVHMAVPLLHRADHALSPFGPFAPARRYWRGRDPEVDVVARSVDGRHVLVGEAEWRTDPLPGAEADAKLARLRAAARVLPGLPGTDGREVVYALFVPGGGESPGDADDVHVVDARTVMGVLR